MISGVVIGKFYPPHHGHKLLIDTARAQVDNLSVIICGKPDQNPPPKLRAEWLREIHPDVQVLEIDDIYGNDDDSQLWAKLTLGWLGFRPDLVFTSEDYGYPYAHYLGSRHIQVDKARQIVPISGTLIRANPLQYWKFLEPCVRAYYAKRVCVLGAESSGTTTLAQALAEHYQTSWVPEYGREYCENKAVEGDLNHWVSAEFSQIAAEQLRREDLAARQANRLLICDTDAFATSIWHIRYLNEPSPAVEAIAATHHYELYLLTDVNIPFVQDGTRDGEHLRHWMHDLFKTELERTKRPYSFLSGPPETRLKAATRLIDALLADPPVKTTTS